MNIQFVDESEGPTIRQRPTRKFYFGRFAPGVSYAIPKDVFEKYDGVFCLIRGGEDSPNEETFNAMQKKLETIADVGVHSVVYPARNRNGSSPYDVHYLIIVGNIEKGLEALKQNAESYSVRLALKSSIERIGQLRTSPVRNPAADMVLRRAPSKPEAHA